MGVSRDTGECGTNFAEILSNALPQSSLEKNKEKSSDSSVSIKIILMCLVAKARLFRQKFVFNIFFLEW